MADRGILRRAGTVALVVALLLSVAGVFQHGLWTPDEPREAEVGREVLVSHFSAMPTLGGEPFLEKPPLYAWITAASYSVFGVSAAAARVPSTAFGLGTLVVAYLLGKRVAGRAAGVCSAVVLGTMWQFSETSHKAVLDVALTFFVAAGHLAFLRARSPGVAAYVCIGAMSGLSFLTKAWIGPALLCAPPILAWTAMRDWSAVRRVLPRALVAAVLGVAVLGGPWVMALVATPGGGWSAAKECLVTESVGRSVGGGEFAKKGHANPPWYYLYTALVVLAPWCLAVPAMVKSGALSRKLRGGRALWCALVFATGLVLLSVPNGKRDLYLVPLMPAAAAAVGAWLSRSATRRAGAWDERTSRALVGLAWLVSAIAILAMSYAAAGGPLPKRVEESVQRLDFRAAGVAAVAVMLVVIGAAFCARRARRLAAVSPARTLWALTVLFLVLHGVVGPLVDPLRDMSAGSKEAAALVPTDEPLVAFDADETTLAVVPFFTGRLVANVEDPSDALRALEHGPSKHLLVMDKDVKHLGAALAKRLDLVQTVRFSATRSVNVYALKP